MGGRTVSVVDTDKTPTAWLTGDLTGAACGKAKATRVSREKAEGRRQKTVACFGCLLLSTFCLLFFPASLLLRFRAAGSFKRADLIVRFLNLRQLLFDDCSNVGWQVLLQSIFIIFDG